MKLTGLILVLAVAGLYGCSDKDDTNSGEENASLIEKATHMGGELADKVKQGASEAGEAASASLDKAGEKVGEAVESIKQAGVEAVESAADATKSLAGPVNEDVTGGVEMTAESGQLAGSEIQEKAATAGADLTAVVGSGQETIDQLPSATTEAHNTMQKTVETASLQTGGVIDGLDPAQVATGKTIYSKNCMACHSAGVAGAPRINDAVAWEPRIAQGMDTLNDHAINGFTGSHGVMPPKGGFATLNDDEVEAAVAYMVSSVSK